MTQETIESLIPINKPHKASNLSDQTTDPVNLYLESLAISGRRSVRSVLTSAVRHCGFDGALEQFPWQSMNYRQLAMIRNTLSKQGKSANTINLTVAAIRGVMTVCFHLHLIDANQLQSLQAVKSVRSYRLPSGRSLTESDIKKLYRACQRDPGVSGIRDQALIAVLLSTGLRRSEVISLNIEDYHHRTGQLQVITGKGNKQRIAYLNRECLQKIRHWRKIRGDQSGSLFNPINKSGRVINKPLTSQSVYRIVQQRADQARIGKVRPHDLRRTFVTRLLEAGIDLNTTRQLAGHSEIQTTARYDLRGKSGLKKAISRINNLQVAAIGRLCV